MVAMNFSNSSFKIKGFFQNFDRIIYRRNFETIVEKATESDLYRIEFIRDVFKNVKNYVKVDKNIRNVIVEFSSPNIAKPFHIGHLRSTIVGNFLANLLEKYAACRVTRLNYLGDWGIQFGLLKIGLDYLHNNKSNPVLKKSSKNVTDEDNPIKLLYEAYVVANKLAENDDTVLMKARTIFQLMENGSDDVLLNDWNKLQKITVDYLKKTYLRLGIVFDYYDFESFYSSNRISDLINQLRKILIDNQKMYLDNKEVIVIKSDNTTLYLTRDLAAALDRYRRFQFDRMFYVVGDQQIFHFKSLFHLMSLMKIDWIDKLQHIRFGNISGMSTRKGNSIFLSDILDELSERMYQKQLITKTTKVEDTDRKTADILAVSCMIINDLKHRRTKCFHFDWDNALNTRGDSGVRLQYTHCRLCSVIRNSNNKIATEVQPMFFLNSEHSQDIMNLINCIAEFQNVLKSCYDNLESYYLVKYVFRLCNQVNQVVNELRVNKLQENDAGQALLLFETSRFILKNSMEILGLPILDKM